MAAEVDPDPDHKTNHTINTQMKASLRYSTTSTMERSTIRWIILAASYYCIAAVAQNTDEPTTTPFPTFSPTVELELPTTVPATLPFFMTISVESPVMGMGEGVMGGMGMSEKVGGGAGTGDSTVKAKSNGTKEVMAMGMGEMGDKRLERYLRNV